MCSILTPVCASLGLVGATDTIILLRVRLRAVTSHQSTEKLIIQITYIVGETFSRSSA